MHRRKQMQFAAVIAVCVTVLNYPFSVQSAPTDGVAQEVSDTKVKNYGVVDVNTHLNVRKDKGTQSEIIATLPDQAVCYIQAYEDGWAYMRSGEIYGYVDAKYLIKDDQAWSIVHDMGEENMPVAYWIDVAEDNYAVETEAGIQEAFAATIPAYTIDNTQLRQEIVGFAEQFLGNPYVWGGTSLTNGADCSGFIQSVYAQFGIQLPRVSHDQAQVGIKIPIEEIQPGDLIFYEKDGEIYHVVMYIGDGQVIHASSAKAGIKISNIFYENAIYAVTVI